MVPALAVVVVGAAVGVGVVVRAVALPYSQLFIHPIVQRRSSRGDGGK